MDAMNVVPQPSPAALFAFVAPVAAGKTGVATGASPATDSVFAELFARVGGAESSAATGKGGTDAELEVAAGAKAEKEGNETEVSVSTANPTQVALAVPLMAPATVVTPSVQKDAPQVFVQESATSVIPTMPLPAQEQPAALVSAVVGAAVEAPAAAQTVATGQEAAALPQQKAGGQESAVAAPQKAGAPTTSVFEAKVTVVGQAASVIPVETAVPEHAPSAPVATVEAPAFPGATVAVTPAAEQEPVDVAVFVARPEDVAKKRKTETADTVKAVSEPGVAPTEAVAAEPTALPGSETVAVNGAQAQGKSTSHHGKTEHAMPEVAADKEAVADKEAGSTNGKDSPVIKAAAEKAAFSPESGDKEAKSGNEEKGGAGVSHNPLMGEAVKTAAVESVHKADGGRSATAENVLAQVKETLAMHNPREAKQITMTLNPAELGELKINVSMDGQQLKVHVVAENAMVRDVLLANLDTLKESLAKQNVSVERFNVSTGGSYTFNQPSGEEKWLPQRSSHQSYAAMGGMVADGEEQQISYLTGTGNGLVDVRF